jgi:hypothetical protein
VLLFCLSGNTCYAALFLRRREESLVQIRATAGDDDTIIHKVDCISTVRSRIQGSDPGRAMAFSLAQAFGGLSHFHGEAGARGAAIRCRMKCSQYSVFLVLQNIISANHRGIIAGL